MKKITILFMSLVLVLALCACGQTSVEQPTESATTQATETTVPEAGKLLVGYARADVTPKITTPLRGFGSTSDRMSNTVLEPLYATCIAVTGDNGVTALFITLDNCSTSFEAKARPIISEQTGVPQENIYLSATHTHAAPDLSNSTENFYFTYIKELHQKLADCSVLAMLDRSEADLSYGTIETEGMTFTRHYVYTNTNGTPGYSFGGVDAISNHGQSSHLTEPYTNLHVLRFAREDSKDIVMVNWRAHPLLHSGEGRLETSADFVGGFRTSVELMLDCHFAYFQGASGNMNSITAIPTEVRTEDNYAFGAIMAEYVSECLANNMQAAEGTTVKMLDDTLIANADLNLSAIAIGDSVAVVTAPNELFDSTTVYMEQNSPYPMSLTLGYTNGGKGYVPNKELYEYLPDYEWYEVGVTKVEAGTAERLQLKFVEMLEKLVDLTPVQQTEEMTLTAPEADNTAKVDTLAWNVYRWDYTPGARLDHSSREPGEDGYYHVVFAVNGKQETLRVKSKELIQIIDFNDITGLVIGDDGVVTDVKVLRECTNGLAANRSIVTGVSGDTVSCITGANGGVPFELKLTQQTKIYDVSTADENCGIETTLRADDQIAAVYDNAGEISYIFVVRRAHVEVPAHDDHCICGGAAEGLHGECAPITDWIAWGDDPEEWDCLPAVSGNYYLTRDVFVPYRYKAYAGEEITICLNGKQIYCNQSRMFAVMGTLNICDCRFTCEDGVYTYEGTILFDYNNAETSSGGAFYMYRGSSMSLYSGNVVGTGTLKYGGLIYTNTNTVTNIYNANLSGGVALNKGGVLYIANGEVNIYGGTITGGNATQAGSGIYFSKGTLTISGAPKITGNKRTDLSVAEGGKIVIGEGGLKPGAEIGISLDSGTGIFATNATKEDAKSFAVAKDSKITWNSETKELSVEKAG